MTAKKLMAVALIFLGAFIGWMILGATNTTRTDSSFYSMKSEVAGLYGGDLIIATPRCYRIQEVLIKEKQNGVELERIINEPVYMELLSSRVDLDIELDQRKRGNLWFPTFKARYKGEYLFSAQGEDVFYFTASLDSADSIYRNINLEINGDTRDDLLTLVQGKSYEVLPDEDGNIRVILSYESTGMENLFYRVSNGTEISQLNDFSLRMTTDFEDFDFPPSMISPGEKSPLGEGGYELLWNLDKAVTGKDVGLIIPNKLNPGEIVSRVTFFAPVPLLFFFTVLLIITAVWGCAFHPMHYFFLAASFFAFHLMFSYFSDHMNLYLSFIIASVVSLGLTVSYLRLFAPARVAYGAAPATQLIYLVLFSYSFFFDGMTGLILTICSVATLFVLMQITGKVEWERVFKKSEESPRPLQQEKKHGPESSSPSRREDL